MVTVYDVARMAGVSGATVSRAVNNPEAVSPDTLARITKAIDKLGYAPNMIARSLKAKASHTVGVIIPDITNPFQVKIAKGVERILSAAGYTPILCDTEESPEQEARYLSDLMDRRIDGLILVPALESRAALPMIRKRGLPAVLVDRAISPDHDSVRCNNLSGISLLVGHLVQLGRDSIHMIGGPQGSWWAASATTPSACCRTATGWPGMPAPWWRAISPSSPATASPRRCCGRGRGPGPSSPPTT